MKAHEARLNMIDRSAAPFGTREQRERFEESMLARGYGVTYATQETLEATGKPGWCIRIEDYINLKTECILCGRCNKRIEKHGQ